MATDRLRELGPLPTLSAEPEPEPEPGAEPGMAAAIIAEFEAMRAGLDEIAEHSEALVAGHRKMLASTYDTAVLKDELERRNAAVSSVSERLRGTLREMGAELSRTEEHDPATAQRTAHRMRRNIHVTVTVKLMNLMGEYQDQQLAFRQSQREAARRQMRAYKPNATEAELQEAAEGGGQIFARLLQGNSAALEDVQAKHDAIQRIEKDVAAVHALMVDLALLVENQGEVLDRIEGNVEGAREYVQRANEELQEANARKARGRRLKTLLAGGLGLAAAPVVAPVAAAVPAKVGGTVLVGGAGAYAYSRRNKGGGGGEAEGEPEPEPEPEPEGGGAAAKEEEEPEHCTIC